MEKNNIKAFVSYSWSSPGHCDLIRSYAERLINDGVDVMLDQWGLSEGQDKYAFMEKMVADPSVTHVVIFSDSIYSSKADSRTDGVGTESQIISKTIYDRVDQTKFIPVVCEMKADGEPYLPVFLSARIWIDFSSPERANENWEKLLRALYGKPIHQKPELGKPPSYITADEKRPALPTIGKLESLKNALLNSRPTIPFCRNDFLAAAFAYADSMRVREPPNIGNLDEKVLVDLRALLPLRDQIVEWLVIEAALPENPHTAEVIIAFLERFLPLKYRPAELTQWQDTWFDTHAIFIYEVFLYVIAVLLKWDRPDTIHELLTTHYLLPESETHQNLYFVTFEGFFSYSQVLAMRNERLKLNRISLLADIIKERATSSEISFRDVMQAELLVTLMAILSDEMRWYPHTIIYAGHGSGKFPLFMRAAQHKHFQRLATITGIASADDLRTKFQKGCERCGVNQWLVTWQSYLSLSNAMNMGSWDSII